MTAPRARRAAVSLAARVALAGAASLAAMPGAGAQPDSVPPPAAGARAPRPASPLFAHDSVVHVTLVADWRAVGGERDTNARRMFPLTVAYDGPDGRRVAIPGEITTRGHYRLLRASCGMPPLRLELADTATRRTLFARQRGLKLVTHCRNGDARWEQYVLREYLAYRAHNVLTPASFRPRLARVRYVDARDTTRVSERWGFFLESDRELSARLGGKELERTGALFDHLSPSSAATLGLVQYLLANPDWSLSYLHNVKLVATDTGTLAVPYDFDFTGLVDTHYAIPDPKLGIRSVRQRLYRGPCLTGEALAPVLRDLAARRPAVAALYDSLPPLDRRYARDAVRFLDEFWNETRDPDAFAREVVRRACQPGT